MFLPHWSALALSVVVAGALAGGTASASNATTVLTCGGTHTLTYSPALTNTPQTVSVSTVNTFGPCVNLLDPLELRTGSASSFVPAVLRSCTSLLGTSSGSRVITWSTGTTSTFAFTATAEYLAGGAALLTAQGTFTAGEFQGASGLQVEVVTSDELANCATTGVSTFSGPTTLTITQ